MNECIQIEFHELLDLSIDGALSPAEDRKLAQHLQGCAWCRSEQQQLTRLGDVLRHAKVEVAPDFCDRVMAELGPTGWEARSPKSWGWAVALCALFAGAAAVLAGFSAARMAPAGSFLSAFGAVFGLFEASLLAGAGLLGASWRGLGLALQEALSGSPMNLAALVAVVVGCNLLFFRLLSGTVAAFERRRSGRTRSGRGETSGD